jgi:hypothetical protein
MGPVNGETAAYRTSMKSYLQVAGVGESAADE